MQRMDPMDFQIERSILKTGNMINNIRDKDLKNNQLTSAQSETILYYADHGGHSIKDLAIHLKVTHQAARKLVDKLKTKGILESFISKDDKRYTNIYLTKSGKQLCAKLKRGGTSTGERILRGFSEEEKERLLQFLQRIEGNMEGGA